MRSRVFTIIASFLILLTCYSPAWGVRPGDFDGDGSADLALWRPSDGTWYVYPSTFPVSNQCPPNFAAYSWGGCYCQWGLPGDTPRPGDFDGDGKMDVAVWRPTTQTWWIRASTNGVVWQVPLGPTIISTDIPDATDVTGDGKADIMMFRRSSPPYWFVRDSATAIVTRYDASNTFANNTTQTPFVTLSARYDPAKTAGIGARYEYNQSPARDLWIMSRFPNFGGGSLYAANWVIGGVNPNQTNVPTRGDWGGPPDGYADYVRFNNGTWMVELNNGYYNYYIGPNQPSWGLPGDYPLSGDYNKDGIADRAVWRPWEGRFYIDIPKPCPSVLHPVYPDPDTRPGCWYNWGLNGDIPIEALVPMSRNYN